MTPDHSLCLGPARGDVATKRESVGLDQSGLGPKVSIESVLADLASAHMGLGPGPGLGQTCLPRERPTSLANTKVDTWVASPSSILAFAALQAPSLSRVHFLQIEGTQKLLNKDLAELINKMRLAQQNAVTSLSEECKRQMLTASHTLAVDAKNLLDAVDQAKVLANLAHPPAE